jgi:hypothetical protein
MGSLSDAKGAEKYLIPYKVSNVGVLGPSSGPTVVRLVCP